MSTFALLVRRYSRANTLKARTLATKAIQESGHLNTLDRDDAAFSTLIGAPTIGAGATAQESPVILALPELSRKRDVVTMAFQRYHQAPELDAIREHPLFPAELEASLLDRLAFSERPPLALDQWLQPQTPDWQALVEAVRRAPPIRRLVGPPSPFLPTWVRDIDRFAARFRTSDRARWVLRSCGFVGHRGLEYLREIGLASKAQSLSSELDALAVHPDEQIRSVVQRFANS